LVSVFAFVLLFFKLGPSALNLEIASLIGNTFTRPGSLNAIPEAAVSHPPRWLSADLQVVRDAFSVFTTDEAPATVKPTSKLDVPVAERTATSYRWFSNEYRWSRNDEDAPVTALVLKPSNSVIVKGQVARFNMSYGIMESSFQHSLQLMSTYLAWSLQNLATFMSFAVDALRVEVAAEIVSLRDHLQELYKPENIKALQDSVAAGAAYSQELIKTSLQRASRMSARVSARICANDRCSPARAREAAGRTLSETGQRGHSTLLKARRGLDNLIRLAQSAVDKAAAEAQALAQGAVTDEKASTKAKSADQSRRKYKRGCDRKRVHAKTKRTVAKKVDAPKCGMAARLAGRCRAGTGAGAGAGAGGVSRKRPSWLTTA
jgi:hypothetical protein